MPRAHAGLQHSILAGQDAGSASDPDHLRNDDPGCCETLGYLLGCGATGNGCWHFWSGYVVTVPAGSCGATGKWWCCCSSSTTVQTFPCCDPAGHIIWSNACRNCIHMEYDMTLRCCQKFGPTYISCGPTHTWLVPCVVGCCLCLATNAVCGQSRKVEKEATASIPRQKLTTCPAAASPPDMQRMPSPRLQ